jgi:hypothetical protein
MADRAKARPKVTTDTIDDFLNIEEEEDNADVEVSSISSNSMSKVSPVEQSTTGKRCKENTSCTPSSKKLPKAPDSNKKNTQKRRSTEIDEETPVQKYVKERNDYFKTKKKCLVDKHNLEQMEKLLDTKEKFEKRGYTKDKILQLFPDLVKVYSILEE